MPSIARLLLLSVAFCSTAGCATADGGSWVELRGKRFTVEVADDAAERERGLMFRDNLAVDHGMIFIHDYQAPQAYWMKNTKIPLDIIYFDAERKLVNVQSRVPPCRSDSCPGYPSSGLAQYTLEINAGVADKLSFKPGDELVIHQ